MTLCTVTFEDYTTFARSYPSWDCRHIYVRWDAGECLAYDESFKSGNCAPATERCDLRVTYYNGVCPAAD